MSMHNSIQNAKFKLQVVAEQQVLIMHRNPGSDVPYTHGPDTPLLEC